MTSEAEEKDLRILHGRRAMRFELLVKQQLQYGFNRADAERILKEDKELIKQHEEKYPD